jgi:hypothetical protein
MAPHPSPAGRSAAINCRLREAALDELFPRYIVEIEAAAVFSAWFAERLWEVIS